MTTLGTPLTSTATKVLLLGAGELGKEVVIELQRLGAEVIAADRYPNAPAMQVAQRSHVLDMLDADALRALIELERPHLVVPEIEAIATEVLTEFEGRIWPDDNVVPLVSTSSTGGKKTPLVEQETPLVEPRRDQDSTTEVGSPDARSEKHARSLRVVPTARATQLTMDREGIRRLAAESLGIPTSPYWFVDSLEELSAAADAIGLPCVVKPVMSSSGKGQSVIRRAEQIAAAWEYAQTGGRTAAHQNGEPLECASGAAQPQEPPVRCIVEGLVDFDYEITLLTVRSVAGTVFCEPIGHWQEDGDYRESWQPAAMEPKVVARAQEIAGAITDALGGWGVFGVELFVRGHEVLFNEVSPRPHDTGLVTLVSQGLSQFAMHARAILGLPVPPPRLVLPSASAAILHQGVGVPVFESVDEALKVPTAQLRLFGKPRLEGGRRRLGVALANGTTVDEARCRASSVAKALRITLADE